LRWGEKEMEISGGKIGAISQKLYDELTAIQWGEKADPFGWTAEV
jgi:branched-chain amino acid aminotransferase